MDRTEARRRMHGPYTIDLHPQHPEHPEYDSKQEPCYVASVLGYESDHYKSSVCTVYMDGAKAIAQRIASLLNAQEGISDGINEVR